MVWAKRRELRNSKFTKATIPTGIVLTLSALLLTLISQLSLNRLLIETSPFLFVAGMFFLLQGQRRGMCGAWICSYLVTILIATELLVIYFQKPLQLAAAYGSAYILSISGLDIAYEGISLYLPHVVLDVAPWCSGINQLIALAAFTIPLSYTSLKSTLHRFSVILALIPISVAINTLRITAIGFWNYGEYREHVHGPYEILLLPIMYPVGIVAVITIISILSAKEKNRNLKIEKSRNAKPFSLFTFVWCIVMLMLTGAIDRLFSVDNNYNHFKHFPAHLGEWRGEESEEPYPGGSRERPDFTQSFLYRNDDGDQLSVFSGSFSSQNKLNKVEINRKRSYNAPIRSLHIPGNDSELYKVRKTKSSVDGKTQIQIYFYWVDGKVIGNNLQYNMALLRRTVNEGLNDATIVIIQGRSEQDLQEEKINQMISFASQLIPIILEK
ncbi:hypothetical protein CHISP_1040 [Chitinispirillum alkaliphilum]|nr:hypothetical protein CHISP_1040 [Chitinispirillum alkaliphilum]